MTTYKRVTTQRCGYLLMIGLNESARLNDPEVLRRLSAALAELEDDDALRCGVLFAAGESFAFAPDSTDELSVMVARSRLSLRDVDPFGDRGRVRAKPVVCAIQGRSASWGTALALAQDAVIASEDAALTLAGRQLSAKRALGVGLVQDVVPAETQLRRALEVAIALAAPRTHRLAGPQPGPTRRRDAPRSGPQPARGWG
jgi:enoyl-CoA hydratase